MKTFYNKIILLGIVGAITAIGVSCTKLEEKPFTDMNKTNFYNNRKEILQAVLRPFTHMQAWLAPTGQNGYWYHSELAADQLAWPQKGRHGYDNGDHFRLHYHTWTSEEGRMRDAWRLIWMGVGLCNAAIEDLESVDLSKVGMTKEEASSAIGELKVLRAFHYMKAMDMWGNIPVVVKVGEPAEPATESRAKVFEFAKKELEENVPTLQPYKNDLVGRVSQTAGYSMLAELYLNAEKWTGQKMYDQCIMACDKILSGSAGGINGGPALAPNINEVFSNKNWLSKEPLFQVAYSRKGGFSFDWGGFLMGYDYVKDVLKVGYGGWNAIVVIPTAFDQFAEKDLRKKDWFLFGPLYKYGTTQPVLGAEEWNGKPVSFVNSIRRESKGDLTGPGSMADGEENSGARFNKYKSGTLDDEYYQENHYMIYRLTEIYFYKAEALMRKNNGAPTQEAVDLLNACRKRAFSAADWESNKYTTANLNLDELLAERGREFIFEGKRRTDLIRFGKFTTASWWDHKPSGKAEVELFPIPSTVIGANPNIEQNPGY